jgi:PPOX class probable F420-dependent enzyme
MTTATTSVPSGPHRYVLAVTALAGGLTLVAGGWSLFAPASFAEAVRFPVNVHFLHDLGAFQLGIGATLLLALAWRDGLALALAGFLVGNTVHAVNHAVDLHLGGRATDPFALAAVSLLVGVALAVRLGELGYVVGEVATATVPALAPFVRQKTILLTSYRRDGTPVGTPVSIAVEGDHAFVRTWDTTWKARRMRNHPEVEIAPATTRGTPTGAALPAHAKLLGEADAGHAAELLARKHPFLQGVAVPLTHRLLRYRTAHFELTPR